MSHDLLNSLMDWSRVERSTDLGLLRTALETSGAAIVSGFPTSVSSFMDTLSRLGTPLDYYGGDIGSHPENSVVWRIKYDEAAHQQGLTHGSAGPLAVHSSQSLRDPRPKYFAMLMANAGWQTHLPTFNGESRLVSWRDAFAHLRLEHPSHFDTIRRLLLSDVRFPDGINRQLVYTISGASDPDDLGVRFKSGLVDHLLLHYPCDDTTQAVALLASAARAVAHCIALRAGDLVVVDNDRWGHGRDTVIGTRRAADGRIESNPRELWSATIDA
jgi:Taurine catabolism dioxygenase TauD, TfdA family